MWITKYDVAFSLGLVELEVGEDPLAYLKSLKFNDWQSYSFTSPEEGRVDVSEYYERLLRHSLPTLSAIDYCQLSLRFVPRETNIFNQLLSSAEHLGKANEVIHERYTHYERIGINLHIFTDINSYITISNFLSADDRINWTFKVSKTKATKILSGFDKILFYLEFLRDQQQIFAKLQHEDYLFEDDLIITQDSVMRFLAELADIHPDMNFDIMYTYRGVILENKEVREYEIFKRIYMEMSRVVKIFKREEVTSLRIQLRYAILPWELNACFSPNEVEERAMVKSAKKKRITVPKYSRHPISLPSGAQSEGWEAGVATWKGQKFVFFEHKHDNSRHGFPHEIEKCLDMWTYTEDLDQFFASLEN